MADDVAHEINAAKNGQEGACVINTNGFKILPSQDDYTLNTPDGISEIHQGQLNDTLLSGQYVDKFDDPGYYYA